MNAIEYLDAAKNHLGIRTDNELANRLHMNRGTISSIREGKRGVPVELAFKLAVTLELDPATVVAELESLKTQNAESTAFWKSFLSRAAMLGVLACTLASNYSEACGSAANRAGGMTNDSAASAVGRLVRIIYRYVMSIIAPCERQNRTRAKNRQRHCTGPLGLPCGFAR